MSIAKVWLLVVWIGGGVLLGGCGSAGKIRNETSRAYSKKLGAGKANGGYYQDDGPLEVLPVQLDAISDAVPRLEPIHKGTTNPYSILGKEYKPEKTLKSFRQRGIASWYGRKYHGQLTAMGERYDMFAMTAAHPTLPLPSYVRVTELVTGRSVIVRINDRGPFYAGRIIDLSYTAAYKLGILAGGTHWVEVEQIIPGENSVREKIAPNLLVVEEGGRGVSSGKPMETAKKIESLPSKGVETGAAYSADESLLHVVRSGEGQQAIYIQLGAFAELSNAERFLQQVQVQLIWLGEIIHLDFQDGFYRVQLGPYGDDEAKLMASRVRRELMP